MPTNFNDFAVTLMVRNWPGSNNVASIDPFGLATAPLPPVSLDRPTPTHYVTLAAAGGGDGSLGDPWTWQEAMANAVAGNAVQFGPGVYVGAETAPNASARRYSPAFRAANNGTLENPIHFMAENFAALTDTDVTDLRSGATTSGDGWPAFGNLDMDYIHWWGFKSSETEANNKSKNDSGKGILWGGTGGGIHYCNLIGETVTWTDNYSGIRCENATDVSVSDNKIYDFRTNGGGSTNCTGLTSYGCVRLELAYNFIDYCGNNVFWKAGTPQYGLKAHHNVFSRGVNSFRIQLLTDTERNEIYQNVFVDYDISAVYFSQTAAPNDLPIGLVVANNIIYGKTASDVHLGAFRYDKTAYTTTTNHMWNNIILDTNSSPVICSDFNSDAAVVAAFTDHQHNCYYNWGSTWGGGASAGTLRSLTVGQWQSTYGMDTTSVFADPVLVDAANEDYRLDAGSPCFDSGVDILQLNGGLATDTINMGVHVSASQNETFGVRGVAPSLASYQLAAGHYAVKKFDMTVVAPRPDSETGGAFVAADFASVRAQHRWAYYDGVNPVRYEYAVKVFGGAAPHMYTLVNAPAGMTIGNDRNAANHGIIKWVPQAAFSAAAPATVEVLVTDQGGETVTVSFTVQTTSSTEKFMFMSQSGNDSTGDGSYASPFATLFKFTGATQATTTYPNRIVYMRGSETPYVTVAHTDAWNGGNAIETIKSRCHLIQARHPSVYLSFPDEAVSIDFSGSQFECNSHDLTFGGSSTAPLMILGSADNAAETHNFWLNAFNRGQFRYIRFDGFVPRTNAAWTNSAPMFSPSATPTNRQYYSLHDVVEINRTETYTNDGLLHVFFSTDYWVEEYCGGSRDGQGTAYKDTNYHTSVRYGDYDNGGGDTGGFAFNFMGQNGSGDNEILYSKCIGRLFFNGQAQATSYVHHAARNTIYTRNTSYPEGLKAWDSAGPFTSVDNVIVAWTPSVSTNIASTGNECHVIRNSTDIPINLTTLALVNATTAYRDLYLGTRGWEIQ